MAEWHVAVEGESLLVTDAGGELKFATRLEGDVVALSFAERSGGYRPVLWSEGIDAVERFLSVVLGEEIRHRRELPPIAFPWQASEVAPGFSSVDLGDRRLRLLPALGSATVTFFQHGTPEPLVEYSYYAAATPADIRESYADPAGLPLFGARLVGKTAR